MDLKKTYNILFISHERKLGGASRSLVALAEQLQSMGHKVYVVVLLKDCPFAQALREKGIEIIPIFFGWWMCPEYWNIVLKGVFRVLYWLEMIAVKYLAKKVIKYQIDIIHSNSSTIDIGAKVAKITNKKHIWHFREFGMEDFQLEYMKGREKSLKFIENNSDGIIFISKKLRDSYSDLLCEEQIRIIYNGISGDYLQEKNFDIKEKVVFLVSGTIVQNKNQILVVKAAKQLLEQGYKKFVVRIAGTSTSLKASQMYEQEIRNYISENSLQDYVIMLGYIKNMKEIRKNADVEIVASRSEAFGRVSVEAMMSSMPVIASEAGANPEIISSGETGYLFQSDCVEELAEAMKKLIDNTGNIKRMGKNAYRIAKETFSAEQNAKAIEAFYTDIIG